MIAHGGVAGAVVEALVVVAVIGVFAAIWLRERGARRSQADDGLSDPDE